MEQMIQRIFDFFLFGGKDFALFVISMIPFIELRGSILLGAAMGIPWPRAFAVSFIGNLLPVPFLILLARPIFAWLKTTPVRLKNIRPSAYFCLWPFPCPAPALGRAL